MKKLLVLGLALFLVAAFTLPASALDNKLGGYWRTRFLNYNNVKGQDTGSGNSQNVDSRTRLYYTATLSDNLKFVLKTEIDTDWGGAGTVGSNYNGQAAADGVDNQIKNVYADINIADFNFKIGTQGMEWGRTGFILSEDVSGISLVYRGSKTIIPALYWVRYNEGDSAAGKSAYNNNGQDSDMYTALVNIKSGNMQFVPYISYWVTNDATAAVPTDSDHMGVTAFGTPGQALKIYYAGLDVNLKFDPVNLMLTGIYQGGDYSDTIDASAYLLDAAFDVKVASFGVHGEAMYATGDDNSDNTVDTFIPPAGASYTWSEGYAKGDIDDQKFSSPLKYTASPKYATLKPWQQAAPYGSKEISDLMAFNLGLDFNMTKTWKASLDWWNINLAEDDPFGNKDIGNEVGVKVKGKVIDNLDVLLLANYMWAGDAFNGNVANQGDPYELAAQLSISW